ncbi:myoD family inhibitor domain-containing protein isoform X1 [Sphaerodactylus townsendi]|uniref:myoD family inhibitor domain-containing protein isoform X1 n=1 Tax=Sphaerodactylus townsendi TaxID=933632 RepID=UPI0020273696|nr:myoD family inhibitor domain-containing protein isoform X1 [Sphaerodactylus townsendi]
MASRNSLCLSSLSHDPQTLTEDQGGTSRCYSCGTLVAQTSMVHQHLTDVSTQTPMSPTSPRLAQSGSHFSPGSKEVELDRLEIERRQLVSRGYSTAILNTILASRRPSTKRIYNTTWKAFVRWCWQKKVPPTEPKISDILAFLQEGLEIGLRANTLRRKVAALTSVLPRLEGFVPTSHPHIVRFLRGATLKDRPVNHHFPTWRLHTVLHALTATPFEPIMDVPLKHLRMKVIFLVVITSARRFSELAAFSIKPPLCVFHKDKVVLCTDPAFVPKVNSTFHRRQEIFLPTFCADPKHPKEAYWHKLDIRAATWSSLSTFVRHYRLNVYSAADSDYSRRVLQHIIGEDFDPTL